LATICPFLGSDCVEDKCKMWRDGDCLIPAFLSTSIVRNIQELSQDEEELDEDEFDEDEFDEDEFDEDEDEDDEDDEDVEDDLEDEEEEKTE
jgi:hypothetical protein